MRDNTEDDNLVNIARESSEELVVNKLGTGLGLKPAEIAPFKKENAQHGGSYMGTLDMLRQWRQRQTMAEERETLKAALKKAGLHNLADKYLFADDVEQHPRHTPDASTVQGASSQYSESNSLYSVGKMSDNTDDVIDDICVNIARQIYGTEVVNSLGRELGFKPATISRFNEENERQGGSYMGTLDMLRRWCRGQRMSEERGNLKAALKKAGLGRLADEYLSADDVGGSTGPEFPQKIEAAQGPSGGQTISLEPKSTIDQPLLDDGSSKPQGDVASGGMDQHSEEVSHKITADLDGTFEDLSLVQGEENVKPIEMECRERVGKDGGKLKLDSFGIELEIPPGAIDCEEPQDICLRVLTDTANIGNSKEEMSVCFGVQCLAPDDLILKLPVTYTIPHCAVITGTRDSGVKVVLYTGEGEYSTNAVVKQRIILSTSGIPSCTIGKDVLKLEMDHFSWLYITFTWVKNLFLGRKKMCCRPFVEKELAWQKTPVILHAHLYDDIKGNSELIEREEGEHQFGPAVIKQHVPIHAAEGDLNMTCHVRKTQIRESVVVSLEKLMGGVRICEHFVLDLPNQLDHVCVALKVGQNERLAVTSVIPFDSQSPHRIERASLQEQVEPDREGHYKQKMKQAKPSEQQLDLEQSYKMDAVTKGHMFILNMTEDRTGSEVDVKNITHVFKEIGYEIETHSDLTAEDLKGKLKQFVEEDEEDPPRHKGMCSAVFLLMAHGNEEGIQCTDKKLVTTKFIRDTVSGMKYMNGKPKMIFYQCCRGGAHGGEMVEHDQAETDKVTTSKSDVFIVHATTYGNKAYRYPVTGSWFIQMLCEELLENAHVSDLSTMLEQVTQKIKKEAFSEYSQTPVVIKQGISKKLYLLPKYPSAKTHSKD